MEIRVKRAYAGADLAADGMRILVDRLWPRGISKENLSVAYWAKDLSPSNELRKWYGHDPNKWEEFKTKYFAELDSKPQAVAEVVAIMQQSELITLVYSSKEEVINNAIALKLYLQEIDGL